MQGVPSGTLCSSIILEICLNFLRLAASGGSFRSWVLRVRFLYDLSHAEARRRRRGVVSVVGSLRVRFRSISPYFRDGMTVRVRKEMSDG